MEKAEEFEKNKIKKRRPFSKTGINIALVTLLSTLRRQCSVVLLSDFSDVINGETEIDFEIIETLSALHNWNVLAIFLDDPQEFAWQHAQGIVKVKNIETGQVEKIKAGRASEIRRIFGKKREQLRQKFSQAGVDSTVLSFGDHFNQLSQFLSERQTTR